ncbi:MAG: primosomal protein N' [Pseudomonadota bacterium]
MRFANVAIPSPVRTLFTYAVPENLDLRPGMRVAVPFRKRPTIGIAFELTDKMPDGLDKKGLHNIEAVLDETPSFSAHMISLLRWMSAYYCTPIGDVVRAALPARLLKTQAPKTTRPSDPPEIKPFYENQITLNDDQQNALDVLLKSTGQNLSSVHLLYGVTGSGKTEVYLRLFAELAKNKKQGLLLVPEIGLTSQLTGRAAAKFKDRVAVYHSGLTDAQRHAQWLRMKKADVDVVIGTRSALFAPLPNLGAIVVDEEHDSSYKQDEGFSYHGRDAAVMRAHIENIPVVLGSATPSLESMSNVKRGKYELIHLPLRTGSSTLPSVEIVDMRNVHRDPAKTKHGLSSLSPALFDAIDDTLAHKEQTLLFIGRRGFSAVHCEECGEAIRCPNCNIALTAHIEGSLLCHYCDYKIAHPQTCTFCGKAKLAPIGHGTQRLAAELNDFFPKANVARLDSDMAASQKKRHKIFEGMHKGKIDILVGTQMVTKGHDFPGVTLVGVVSADQSLHFPDFRAAEKTFQLLTQVAGRAGRGASPGRVIIQTHEPNHPSLICACAHDYETFIAHELKYRHDLAYPPFTRLANIRMSSLDKNLVSKAANEIAAIIRQECAEHSDFKILGPAPAPFEKLRNRYRWQIVIKARSAGTLTRLLPRLSAQIEARIPRKVRVSIDIDPANLL